MLLHVLPAEIDAMPYSDACGILDLLDADETIRTMEH